MFRNIWFVLGFSGIGKSHFCKYVGARNNWLYFEIDFWKTGIQDGLDSYGLREAWNTYEKEKNGGPLVQEITEKYTMTSLRQL